MTEDFCHAPEEFLIFEKPADFSYPPNAKSILRHLDGIVEFPPTLRLQWASRDGLAVVAADAIATGANPNELDKTGALPLDALAMAARKAAEGMLESFQQSASRGGAHGASYSRILSQLADLHEINFRLLAAGAKPHEAFRQMVRGGNFEAAESELKNGLSVDAVTPNGTTLIIERILHRDGPAVAWLLDHGANPDWDCHGRLPKALVRACPYLRVEDSPLLVLTPFSAACIAGFPEGIDLLVKAGSKLGYPHVLSLYKIFAAELWAAWVIERIETLQARRSS